MAAGTTLCMPCRRSCEATTYKSASVEQVLPCQQERGNVHDLYSVTITGWNVMRAISAVCSLFLRKEKLCYYMRTKFADQILRKVAIPQIRESFRLYGINCQCQIVSESDNQLYAKPEDRASIQSHRHKNAGSHLTIIPILKKPTCSGNNKSTTI